MTAWTEWPLTCYDLETTGVGADARIVTACLATSKTDVRSWLLDPGVEIPAEAASVHGVTTERARAEGSDYAAGLAEIAGAIIESTLDRALVAFNASFDLTVTLRECRRLGIPFAVPELVLDPFVVDRAIDPYRKGSRKLPAIAEFYCCEFRGDAHDAAADAFTAGNVAWSMQRMIAQSARGRRHLEPLVGLSAAEMMAWQADAHRARQDSFREWLLRQGKDASDVDSGWPLRENLPPVERAVA